MNEELERQAERDRERSRHAMLNISQRDSGVSSWWNAAKNRLTLTKGPPATVQQVIQAKDRE
jgi:hypothetical protein